MRRMDELYLASPFYGSRRMVAVLRREGLVVNRKRVRRLMRVMGLEAIYQKPNTSQGHPDNKVYPSHGSPPSELEDYFGLVRDHLPTGYLCFIGGASFLATTPFRTSGLEAPADDQSASQSNALKTRKKNEGMIEGARTSPTPGSRGKMSGSPQCSRRPWPGRA